MSAAAEDGSNRTDCSVCGRPSKLGESRCSVGCSLAAKIPLGDGGPLPASWALAAALASGFALFNQWMLWGMYVAKDSQGAVEFGQRFEASSIVVGSLWLVTALGAWGVSRPKRLRDFVTFFGASAIVLLPGIILEKAPSYSTLFLVSNLLISCGFYRGIYALWKSSKKMEK